MDLEPAAESAEPANAREKRAAPAEENGDFGDRRKRMKNGGADEAEMRRIAEIVLVLSAMGTMRGGRNPTAPEKAMMAEARAIAVSICEELAPKDIVPREAFGGIIEDLGLNRLKEQKLALRPPKQSIVEKMESSKRRIEESKSFAAQAAAADTIQRAQAVGENRVTPNPVHTFSSDKSGHMQASAGTFRHNSATTGNVSSASSTILYFQTPNSQVRTPLISTGLPNTNLGRDSASTTSRADISHLGSDGRVNGPSQAPNVPTGYTVKTKSSISTNVPPLKSQPTNVQDFSQSIPGTAPTMHHPIQATQFVHAAQHLEISKIVQKLLHPKPLEHTIWSPPSKDYMTKSVPCQMCKLSIKEVDNMFVCDACEKGFHSKCLQSTNQKFVPRGEWYCPRCMTVSGGKPFPPKYGRVTRNLVTNNITSSKAQDQNAQQPDVKAMQTNKINESEDSSVIKKEEIPTSQSYPDNKVETEAKESTGFDESKDLHVSSSHSLVNGTEAVSTGVFQEQEKESNGTKTDDGIPTCDLKPVNQDMEQDKQDGTEGISNELHVVDWIGDLHEVVEDKKFYKSCQINGVVYNLHDYAIIQLGNNKLIPWKLQGMWEDSQTGSKWVAVNRCYFPVDLPALVGHPSAPESNEVYESNDENTLMAGLIEGPCTILPAKKFGETDQRDDLQTNQGRPVFLCRWFYDKIKGVFRPIPS